MSWREVLSGYVNVTDKPWLIASIYGTAPPPLRKMSLCGARVLAVNDSVVRLETMAITRHGQVND
jgi:hypothetical protein